MAKRSPIRLAIAGLTAVAVAIAPVTVPDTTLLTAAVAQAQNSVTVTGTNQVTLNEFATFTANVPNATAGSVQFYLDGVPQGAPVQVSNGKAISGQITAVSYATDKFPHTVTARYIDVSRKNPLADGTTTFTTPVRAKVTADENGIPAKEQDADTYFGASLNGVARSLDNPAVLKPGSVYEVQMNMRNESLSSRKYEYGINPPAGSAYVDGSAKKTDNSTWRVTTRANYEGIAYDVVDVAQNAEWGKRPSWVTASFPSGATMPKVNPGYVGLQVGATGTYNEKHGNTYPIAASFGAPTTPGLYVPEYAVYKYGAGLHALTPMEGAAFRVEPKPIPPRDQGTSEPEQPQPGDDNGSNAPKAKTNPAAVKAGASPVAADFVEMPAGATAEWKDGTPTTGGPAYVLVKNSDGASIGEIRVVVTFETENANPGMNPNDPANETGNANSGNNQNVPAGRVVYDKKPSLNRETTLTAHVKAGTEGKVRFIIKDELGNEVLTEDKRDVEIVNDKAEVKVAFGRAGTYSVETQIVPADGTAPYANTDSARFEVKVGGTKGPLADDCKKQIGIGVGLGLTGLIIAGLSQMRIPNLQQMVVNLQQQLGIFNPQLAGAAERGIPVAGGLIGLVLTGLSIGSTIDKCAPGEGSSRQSETTEGETA